MPTYDDIGKGLEINTNLQDEMKPNGVDLKLPYEDFNSGWILLAKGSTVTINHNFGTIPRLASAFINTSAVDLNCDYVPTYDSTATCQINNLTTTSITVKNNSSTAANKYIKILLWR